MLNIGFVGGVGQGEFGEDRAAFGALRDGRSSRPGARPARLEGYRALRPGDRDGVQYKGRDGLLQSSNVRENPVGTRRFLDVDCDPRASSGLQGLGQPPHDAL